MTVFRNRKTAEMSGAENRYLFEFRFVAIRLRIHIAEAIAARGDTPPSKHTLPPVI